MTDTHTVPVEVEFLGHSTTCMMSSEEAARYGKGRRTMATMRQQRQDRRLKASEAYQKKPTERRRIKLIEAIDDCTSLCDSHQRAEVMMQAILGEPAEIFWPVFLSTWSACDMSWRWSAVILGTMRYHRDAGNSAEKYIHDDLDGGDFYEDLPDLIEVWRGTDRPRVRSIAWTTDRKIAEQFATGMRRGAFDNPVIAHAFIRKTDIFFATESEAEVVLDPRRLRKLTIEPFTEQRTLIPAKAG
jgi:hypothetical protein